MSSLGSGPIKIPESALNRIASHIFQHGSLGVETGGFFLSNATDVIAEVAFAGDKGILRKRDQFAVSGRALDRLFTWVGERQLYVTAQFHSHGGHHGHRPFLSITDQQHGFRVERFISSVIPGFTAPPLQPQDWGWWQFREGRWVEVPPASVVAGAISFITFDEDGVHGA
ncbi:MAG: hypothetical protein KGJ86_00910 [Chloroflexota bacterium]|nr:hypothetical protein [Chloroflexota bacterium]